MFATQDPPAAGNGREPSVSKTEIQYNRQMVKDTESLMFVYKKGEIINQFDCRLLFLPVCEIAMIDRAIYEEVLGTHHNGRRSDGLPFGDSGKPQP